MALLHASVRSLHAEVVELVSACFAGDKDVNTAAEYLNELTVD